MDMHQAYASLVSEVLEPCPVPLKVVRREEELHVRSLQTVSKSRIRGHLKERPCHGKRRVGDLLAVERLKEYRAFIDRLASKVLRVHEAHPILLIHVLFYFRKAQSLSPLQYFSFSASSFSAYSISESGSFSFSVPFPFFFSFLRLFLSMIAHAIISNSPAPLIARAMFRL